MQKQSKEDESKVKEYKSKRVKATRTFLGDASRARHPGGERDDKTGI